MTRHPLETILAAKLAHDPRPPHARDTYQSRAGRKRTTLVGASVLPIKSETEGPVANAGQTVWGALKQGPMTLSMFKQGQLDDCFLLATGITRTLDNPNWTDDIIIPVDAKTVIVQYVYGGNIVRITCTLEVSTGYNNSTDDDVRVELLEKTYGFLRSGIADYTKDDFGSGTEVFMALGMTVEALTKTPAAVDAARAAGKGVVFITSQTATLFPASHCEALKSSTIAINPWDGSVEVAVTPAILASSDIVAIYAGTMPNPPILQKPPEAAPMKISMFAITINGDGIVWTSTGATTAKINGKSVALSGTMPLDGSPKYDLQLFDANGVNPPDGSGFGTVYAPTTPTNQPAPADPIIATINVYASGRVVKV